MASGLQCPGCGHVHPAGLPEIARGDATFRCYGCYRMLSVPAGWTARPASRPAPPELPPTGDGPPGAGTRDARSARLAGRRGTTLTRGGAVDAPPDDRATQMTPVASAAGSAGAAAPGAGPAGGGAPAGAATPRGRVAPRRSAAPLSRPIRAGVWTGAFALGLLMGAFILRKLGWLDVDTVIDLYAGSGPGRFAILLALLPLWALISAAVAHFSLEALARRSRGRSVRAEA